MAALTKTPEEPEAGLIKRCTETRDISQFDNASPLGTEVTNNGTDPILPDSGSMPSFRGHSDSQGQPSPTLAPIDSGNYASRLSMSTQDAPTSTGGNALERVSPGGAVRAMVLAGVHIRLIVAILLSIALWSGYFWVVGYTLAS